MYVDTGPIPRGARPTNQRTCHFARLIGPEPGQTDSPTAGLSDYRNSAPSPRKPDSPQQPINCTNTCSGISHMVPPLRFRLRGSICGSTAGRENKVLVMGQYFCPGPGPIPQFNSKSSLSLQI